MANKTIQLQDNTGANNLYPIPAFPGIDTTNIIATNVSNGNNSSGTTYYLPQDCFIVITDSARVIYIDDVVVLNSSDSDYAIIPGKQGQSLKCNSAYSNVLCKIYGLKY